MKTVIEVVVTAQEKFFHTEKFNIIQFPSGEIGGNFSEDFVKFTERNAGKIDNVILTVQGYDKDTLFALALAKDAVDSLVPHKSAMKTVVFGFLPNA